MLRKFVFALAALALGACGAEAPRQAPAAESRGYTLEVRAKDGETVYLVTDPEGRLAGARAAEGGPSAVLAQREARALAATAPEPIMDPGAEENVKFALPGFSLAVSGKDGEGEGGAEHGRVEIKLGETQVHVEGEDGEGGHERANVRISGVDAGDARDFITDAEDLSPEVKAEMLDILGLE